MHDRTPIDRELMSDHAASLRGDREARDAQRKTNREIAAVGLLALVGLMSWALHSGVTGGL